MIMTKVLHVHASPKREYSASGQMADIFLDEYRKINPAHEIETLWLFESDLPEFGFDQTTAKFAPIFGDQLTQEQEQKWQVILDVISRFDKADKIIVSTPMWNGSIPYKLKHYIDIIVQPLVTFGFNPETGEHFGLLKDRPLQFVLTRSSVPVGDPFDNQLPYLRSIFGFMGILDHRVVVAESTTRPTSEERAQYIAEFSEILKQAAAEF